LWISNSTFGQDGIQLEYNGGNPRGYIGDGANAYFNFDGTKITWKATNTELDASGNLTATSATLSGAVTSTSGAIGGWTLAATTLSGGNVTLSSTGAIQVGTGDDILKITATDGTYRLTIGDAVLGDAPFRVTKAGALIATSATLTGTLSAAGGIVAIDSGGITIVSASDSLTYLNFKQASTLKGTISLFASGGLNIRAIDNEDVTLWSTGGDVYIVGSGVKLIGVTADMSAITDYLLLPDRNSDPADVEGAVYYDSSVHAIKCYNGTAWRTVEFV